MIKECLLEIVNSKLDLGDLRKKVVKTYINAYDDEQLFLILKTPNGLLAHDINIIFIPNVGFRCFNDTRKVGKLPMCNIFQKILNDKYHEFIT